MLEIFIGIIIGIVPIILTALFTLVFIGPFKKHNEIFKKILKLKRDYTDQTDLYNDFVTNSIAITNITKQNEIIEEIIGDIQEQMELHKFFSKIVKYELLEIKLKLLFSYNLNPILLNEDKEFKDEERLDSNLYFSSLIKMAKFP